MNVELDQTYIMNGKHYGPGVVEVDEDTGKALKARMAQIKGTEEQTDGPIGEGIQEDGQGLEPVRSVSSRAARK